MLTGFTIKTQFYKLVLRLDVDCERKNAELLVIYDKIIQSSGQVEFAAVREPEAAEAWLRRPMGEFGSFIEFTERMLRRQAVEAA